MRNLILMLVMLLGSYASAQHGTYGDYQVIDADFRNEVDTFNNNTYDWAWAQDQITFDPRNNPAHRSDFTSNSINRFGQSGTVSITVTSVVTEGDFTNYKWGTRTEPTSAVYLNRGELVSDAQTYVDAVAGREVFIWEISDRIYTASIGTTTFTFTSDIIAEDLNHFEGTRIHHDAQDEIVNRFVYASDVERVVTGFTQALFDNPPAAGFDFPSQFDGNPSVTVLLIGVRMQRGHLIDSHTRTPVTEGARLDVVNSNYQATGNCVGPANYHDHLVSALGSALTIIDEGFEYTFTSPTSVDYTILLNTDSVDAVSTVSGNANSERDPCANVITDWLLSRD